MEQFSQRRVYVVDDDDAVRDSMRALLESSGLDVRDYPSAQEFLCHTSQEPKGCLLVDFHMPRMTGLELLELLRGRGSRLPVIVITGRSDPALKEKVLRAGGQELLDKPVDEAVLMGALDRAFASQAAAT